MIVQRFTAYPGLVFILIACGLFVSVETQAASAFTGSAVCSQIDIQNAIEKLSLGRESEVAQARSTLRNYAQRSRACKVEIINSLVKTLNKPNLNFELDQSSYFLWRGAAPLLGKLQASEAIPIFIEHLDLNDGIFSASMMHQPAIVGLITMGPSAIPQLRIALLSSSNPNIRIAAAFCLTSMGGDSAMMALRKALRSEQNRCVSRFVDLSIVVLEGKKNPPTEQIKDRQEWLTAFRCR
jgi:HEAT repeat protein